MIPIPKPSTFQCVSPTGPQALPSGSQRWAPQRAAGHTAGADVGSSTAAHHDDAHTGTTGSLGTLLCAEDCRGIWFDDSHLDVMNGKFWGYLTYMWVICCENVGQFFGMSHYDLTWWFGSGEASPNGRTFQLFSGWWIIMIQPDGFWWLAKLRFLKNNVAPMS